MNKFYCGVGLDAGHRYTTFMKARPKIVASGVGGWCPRCIKRSEILRQGKEPMNEAKMEQAARAAHEVNRAYCIVLGDMSQPAWEDAPDWQRSSALNGVRGVIAGNTPEQSHESWLAEKTATGWKFGPVKDPDKKEHPCFVPYAELPAAQKAKDALFVAAVRGVLGL